MAIRFGMSIAEAILQLTRGFRKMTGRNPDGLEKIKIQQEAVKKIEDLNKVVDMDGNVIDTSKGIMGGKQIQDSPEFGKRIKETYDKAKGPGKGQEMVDAMKSPGAKKSYEIIEDQLGVKLYGDESFEEILQIQKTGKHPRGEPKAEGGRIGYADGTPSFEEYMRERKGIEQKMNLEQMYKEYIEDMRRKGVAEQKTMAAEGGRIGLKDGVFKKGLKAITGSDTYKTLEDKGFNTAVALDMGFNEIFNILSSLPFAEGGRAAFKDGPKDPKRRGFIKAAVGIASMLPGIGILGKGAKVAAPAVKKAAEIAEPALAKLVETVMSTGKLISVTGKRVKEMVTKKKLGKVEVEEDIMDNSYIIKKDGKEIYYKPGRMDETGGIDDSIIEVVDKTIKKSSGGVARMLGE